MRLPEGLRNQAGWVFIGGLAFLAGLSYLLGIAESTSITRVLDQSFLRVWGGFLSVAGGLIVWSTWVSNKAAERLALRLLSLGMLVYGGWILVAVPLTRATFTVFMCLGLIGLSEIRVAVLSAVLRSLPDSYREEA